MQRVIAITAAVVLFSVCPLYAEYSVMNKGTWPDTWPKELEELREQSRTLEGPQVLLLHYAIPFSKRESFEAAWPHLLKVKSPGAPIVLRPGPSFWLGKESNAGVCVHTPPKGQAPIADANKVGGRRERTIYLELIVDGEIIDLNRISLPPDTPIVDERFKPRDGSPPKRAQSQPSDSGASRIEALRPEAAAALAGSWQAESVDGRAVSDFVKVVFTAGKVEGLFQLVDPVAPDGSMEGARQIAKSFDFRVFRHGEFNAIDVDVGGKASRRFRGIYKIEDDVLTMAFRTQLDARSVSPWVDKDGRPNTFDPGHVVLRVFRRMAMGE